MNTIRDNGWGCGVAAVVAVNKAKGEADANFAISVRQADANLYLAEKQAQSLALIGKQLNEFPTLIQYEMVQKLNNVQWGFLPSGALPLFQIPNTQTNVTQNSGGER